MPYESSGGILAWMANLALSTTWQQNSEVSDVDASRFPSTLATWLVEDTDLLTGLT